MRSAARAAAAKPRAPQTHEQKILMTVTLCLLAAGTVMVYSASSAQTLAHGHGAGAGSGVGAGYLIRYVVYGALGLVAMRVAMSRGLGLVARVTPLLLAVSFVLVVAVHIPHLGVRVNGARRWIGAGPVQFQPSELMKLALVFYTCLILAKHPRRIRSLHAMRPLLYIVVAGLVLVASQPDLGTAMVIAFTIGALFVIAGMSTRHLWQITGAVAVVTLLFAVASPYRAARLTSFVNPWAHAAGSGFQAVQGQIAIGSGGLLGRGPGRSVEKIFYLPEAHTDFILAVIGEEVGIAGIACLLLLYGLIAYAGLRAAKEARDPYAKLLAAGLTSMIVCQALLNVFAVLGIAPLTGVPLPFVSYGASNLVILLAGMGVLLNIASTAGRRPSAVTGWRGERARAKHPDRGRGDGGARRPGSGGRRRAAG